MQSYQPPQPLLCYSFSPTPATSPDALEGKGLNAFPGTLRWVFEAWISAMSLRRSKVLVSGGLCAVVALGLGLSVQQRSSVATGPPDGRRALVRVLGAQRFVEGRLTGGFGHDVYRPSGKVSLPIEVSRTLRSIEARDATSSPEALADRGILELFAQKRDEAINHLEEAAARSSRDARISSDLAAAYLERGLRTGRALDDFLALVAAERAFTNNPLLPEALFNRALVFERLGLTARARADWVRYLSLEADSDWSAEGEEHLEALEQANLPRTRIDRPSLEAAAARGDRAAVRAAVDPLRQPSRRLGEEELLPAWARAYLAGDVEQASRALRLARALGEALLDLSHDNLLHDAVAVIDSASPDQLEVLARGHLDYQAGRSLFAAADYAGAAGRLRDAQSALARGRSPFALRAELALGTCENLLSLRPSALQHFADVAAGAADNSYLSLLGENFWMEGLVHYVEQDLPPAILAYGRALEIFEAIREPENIAGARSLLAEAANYEGRTEDSWQHRLSALRETMKIGDPQRLFQVYVEATTAATRQGEHRIALYFQEETLRNARLAKNPVEIAHALYWRGRNHQALGLTAQAGDDLRRARVVLAGVKPSQIRGTTEADISLVEAELAAEKTPQEAVPLLSRALDLYLQGGYRYNLIDILRSRSRAFASLGDLAAAEADLESAARWIEDWRGRIDAPAERISFLAKSEQLFDTLALLHLEGQGDPEQALDTLERQRARALLDSVLPSVEPLTTREIAAGLAEDTVVVSYALLEDRLNAFVIDRHGMRLEKLISKDWPSIERGIAAYRAGLAGHADIDELDRRSGALYETLIEPLAEALPADAHLILSCDGSLQRLPFAALRNPRTGRYLVQDHLLTIAPSASVYLASVQRFRRLAHGAPRSVLVVSNSLVDRGRHPELRPLRWAAEEARHVAAYYPGAAVWKDQEATVETFLREAPDAEIVHFLGHAIKNGDARGACLVLTGRPGVPNGDLLCGEEIERLRLNRTRLVILSACGTADGRIARGEGIESLARSFVAAGAPAVIGTSWNVKDLTSHLFVTELHRKLREGVEPGEALRSTQLGFIRGPDLDRRSPRFWANFQLTGGTS
jgi:CHAT domain-containing protein